VIWGFSVSIHCRVGSSVVTQNDTKCAHDHEWLQGPLEARQLLALPKLESCQQVVLVERLLP